MKIQHHPSEDFIAAYAKGAIVHHWIENFHNHVGTKEEVEEYKEKDPIETTKEKLLEGFKVSPAVIEAIDEKVKSVVDECVKFAEESPWPDNDELLKDVYQQADYPFILD